MDRMDAVLDARLRRRDEIRNPLTGAPMALGENDRTLPQMLRNQESHDLFLSHAYAEDPEMAKGMALALTESPTTALWTPEQNTFAERIRQSLNRQTALANVLRDAISEQEIVRMAGRDPRIHELINRTENIADARRVMLSQLTRVAVENTAAFQSIVDNLLAARTLQSGDEARNAAANVTERLTRYGFTEEEYRNAMAQSVDSDELTPETRAALYNTMRERMGSLARLANSLSLGWVANRRFRDLEAPVTDEHELFRRKQQHMHEVGTLLHATLDPDMLIAVQTALRDGGRAEVRHDERTVKTLPQYCVVRDSLKMTNSPEARQARYLERVAQETERLDKTIPELTDEQWEAIDEGHLNSENHMYQGQRQNQKATGLVAALLEFFWPSETKMRQETAAWRESARAPL